MGILLIFAFLSGVVTIFAPCIWPLLPIILSASSTGGHKKPLGITLGIVISFAIFTLTISYIVKIIPFDPNVLRVFAVLVIGFLGLTLLIPALSEQVEGLVSKISSRFATGNANRSGFLGGFVTGIALGAVWSPCAGPILATIATLAATTSVNAGIVLVTIAYVTGVGIPLFLFATIGSHIFSKSRVFSQYTGRIQQVFGVVMILTAVAIYTNYDKVLQVNLLNIFPEYSGFINNLEGSKAVQEQLNALKVEQNTDNALFNVGNGGSAPDFSGGGNWLNSKPLSIKDLKGKVVLVDFWTYTCINCIRTLPHVTSWYDTYKDSGFVVIGVHTPEFSFEKNTDNVKNAIAQYKINYPVVQDNDFAIWNAYQNQYWPAEYLIDATGKIRRTHFGEGEYEEMEKAIKTLLEESGKKINTTLPTMPDQTPHGQYTPETYVGSSRLGAFASNENITGGMQTFTKQSVIPLNAFAYIGEWSVQDEFGETGKNAVLEFNINTNKAFLVITPQSKNDKIRVLLDGEVVNNKNQGADVKDGFVQIDSPRLYNLIDLGGNAGVHMLRLEFQTPGTKVFAFTFG